MSWYMHKLCGVDIGMEKSCNHLNRPTNSTQRPKHIGCYWYVHGVRLEETREDSSQ
jgi:hypothetical protein